MPYKLMSKPTPESVREALERFAKECENPECEYVPLVHAPHEQADAVLRWLWEEWSRDKKVKHLFTYAMRCADVLYGEDKT